MSIDRPAFVREFTILLERFGRASDVSDILIERYRAFLDAHLTTEEFQAAAREIFNHDQFWPSPQRFVDAVRGNAKELAATEWQRLLDCARRGDTLLPGVSSAGRAALKAAGGWHAVASAESDFALDRARKLFSEAFQTTITQPARPALEAPAALQELEAAL